MSNQGQKRGDLLPARKRKAMNHPPRRSKDPFRRPKEKGLRRETMGPHLALPPGGKEGD